MNEKRKATLEDILKLVPETQEAEVLRGDWIVKGTCDSLSNMLDASVALVQNVLNIEAKGDVLRVWLEE